jgi:hypothetical protein
MARNNRLYEDALNDAVADFLRARCIRYTWQVPALGGRIDFVGIRPSYEVVALEVKTKNWRQALSQARRYQLLADKAYVALPENLARTVLGKSRLFKESGVGLISIGFNTKILIGASSCKLARPNLREYLLDHTLERRNEAILRTAKIVCSVESTGAIQPYASTDHICDIEVLSIDD